MNKACGTQSAQPKGPASPVLEFHQLVVNLLDVDFTPRNFIVGRDAVNNIIIQFVKLLEQVKLLANLVQLGELGSREAEQLLAHRVARVLSPQSIEAILLE